jgi:hypothetical protein
MTQRQSFSEEDVAAFEPAEKIGLVASTDPDGLPHITLITSMRAMGANVLTLGQFCKGLSKAYIQERPRVAFLVMSMDRRMWRGRAVWTHYRKEGPEYEGYNDIPMFRYNTYFGIDTVHYLDLVEVTGPESLPMAQIVAAALITKIAKAGCRTGEPASILNPFSQQLFNRLDALKFLSYIGEDGFPRLFPVIQCQAADSRRLAFSPLAYREEIRHIPDGAQVAVFGMTMSMEDVLVRGTFTGIRRSYFLKTGRIEIEWVYNSMPPSHRQIYPEVPLNPVTEF